MKCIKYLLSLIILISLSSCGQHNPLIDSSDKSFEAIAVTGENENELTLIKEPSGEVINQNLLASITDETINSPIASIAMWGGSIYVLVPEEQKIVILNRWSYAYEATISYETMGLKPVSIAFANATDAYVAFEDHNAISLLDIKFRKHAHFIECAEGASFITINEGKLYVVNTKANSVSVINAVNYTKEKDIPVGESPIMISVATGHPSAAVICGKPFSMDTTASNLPAACVTYIDINTETTKNTFELRAPKTDPKNIYPSSIALGEGNTLFICTQVGVYRANIRMQSSVLYTIKKPTTSIVINRLRDIFALIYPDGTAEILETKKGEKIGDMKVPAGARKIIIL